jgi:hypothetical protein
MIGNAGEKAMPERFVDILTLLMGALAVGYVVYEIERRRRKLHDVWDVLDEEDALLTAELEEMVERGELQPFAGVALA